MNANAPNFGAMYVMLDEFHRRAEHGLTGPVIAARLQAALQAEIKEGLINIFERRRLTAWVPPAVSRS